VLGYAGVERGRSAGPARRRRARQPAGPGRSPRRQFTSCILTDSSSAQGRRAIASRTGRDAAHLHDDVGRCPWSRDRSALDREQALRLAGCLAASCFARSGGSVRKRVTSRNTLISSTTSSFLTFFSHRAIRSSRSRSTSRQAPSADQARSSSGSAVPASSNERRAAGCDLSKARPRGASIGFGTSLHRSRVPGAATRMLTSASTHARGLTNIVGRSMCLVFQSFASPHTKRGPRSPSSEERTARLLKRLVPQPCAVHFNVGDFASARSVPAELPRSFGLL
jgi:hypothetical protein